MRDGIMRISIMQPYLFPYIGYFQMINCSDYFVFDDSDQYIQRGWINRNRILLNGKDHFITMPVVKDSYRLKINERYFVEEQENINEEKILDTIYYAYHKAPYYSDCYDLIKYILSFKNKNVAEYTANSLKEVCNYLEIETKMLFKSKLNPPPDVNYQDSVIYVCKQMEADCYINAIGGMELYSARKFSENNIELRFIKTRETIRYQQFWYDFIPNLSIIDVMMFNSPEQIKTLLSEYDLIDGKN
ncbi:WbqC family protein [Eubacteriaceae bacterium ES3]|nr:WbqC family protein [Eubacteriaceae bacterium ES3]